MSRVALRCGPKAAQPEALGLLPGGMIESLSYPSMVKLILRETEYEVKPGMTLLSSLEKCNILPESVIATRNGEMILEDEILKDGDVVRLVAVISGGAG